MGLTEVIVQAERWMARTFERIGSEGWPKKLMPAPGGAYVRVEKGDGRDVHGKAAEDWSIYQRVFAVSHATMQLAYGHQYQMANQYSRAQCQADGAYNKTGRRQAKGNNRAGARAVLGGRLK